MRIPDMIVASALGLAAFLPAAPAGASSTLDGYPSQTRYLSNDAPFVVFGVTPTRLDAQAGRLVLTFIATDRLEQVNVFPFVRASRDAAARMRTQVTCGPRDAGSWDCAIPVAELLVDLDGGEGQLGLRIEAHGSLRELGQHSTVIVTVPVRRAGAVSG